jgi:hypothetical protein
MIMRSPDEAATSFAALHAPLCLLKGACRCSQMETPFQASAAVAVICSTASKQHHIPLDRSSRSDIRRLVFMHGLGYGGMCVA